jgi:hypothetical protein
MYRIKVVLMARRNLIPVDAHRLANTMGQYAQSLFLTSSTTFCNLNFSPPNTESVSFCIMILHNLVDGYCSGATYYSHFIAFLKSLVH